MCWLFAVPSILINVIFHLDDVTKVPFCPLLDIGVDLASKYFEIEFGIEISGFENAYI